MMEVYGIQEGFYEERYCGSMWGCGGFYTNPNMFPTKAMAEKYLQKLGYVPSQEPDWWVRYYGDKLDSKAFVKSFCLKNVRVREKDGD